MMFSTSLPLESRWSHVTLLTNEMNGLLLIKVIEFRGMILRFLTPAPLPPSCTQVDEISRPEATRWHNAGQKQLCPLSCNLNRVIQERGSRQNTHALDFV